MASPPRVPQFRIEKPPLSPGSTKTSSDFIFGDTMSSKSISKAMSSEVTSLDGHNLIGTIIADLVADLAENCDSSFHRAHMQAQEIGPRYSHLREEDSYDRPYDRNSRQRPRTRSTAASYTASNLREDLREIRPYLRQSTLNALEGILINGMGLKEETPTSKLSPTSLMSQTSGEGFYVPVILDSRGASRRTSISTPNSAKFREGMEDDGAFTGEKRRSARSTSTRSVRSNLGHYQGANDRRENSGSSFESDMQVPSSAYPSRAKTVMILMSLYISIFLVALDRTIIGPAIPAITNEFNSIDDIGWYGSAYMLTAAGFILLYGRIYTFFPTKPVFLSGICLFEIGSVICGAAQSSMMLIIGRAVAGLGSSGIFTGAVLIMLSTVRLEKRPMLQGLFGACFGVASIAGPLLGGAFTQSTATWRWCFYINLPLGGITLLVVTFLLKLEKQKSTWKTWGEIIRHLDPLGTALFLPSMTCLLLALEWGAAEYSWSSMRIILLLVVFALLLMAFVAWQYVTRHTTATIPAHIIFQRSVACGGASQFCVGATMLTVSIYIPLWFQAIKGASAMQSGINTIPLVLSVVLGSILSGGLVQRFGYYTPFMIVGSALMAVGTGLLTTWDMTTGTGMWIGYQIIVGFGVGCTMQHPNIAVQTVLRRRDIATGTAVLSLCQTLGGAVFTAVGQNLYIGKFTAGLDMIEGISPERVLGAGATDLTDGVPTAIRPQILEAYNISLSKGTFFAAFIIACFAVPAALGMEWRSVKPRPGAQPRNHAPGDVEKQEPHAYQPRGILKKPVAAQRQQNTTTHLISPPTPVWNKTLRGSGNFSSMLTAKVNPDLHDSLVAAISKRDRY